MKIQLKTVITKFTGRLIFFALFTNSAYAQSNFFAAKNGTYTTSRMSSLNSYIGVFESKKYHLNDGEYQAQPTLIIEKVASHEPYGYTLEISFPCDSTKVVPTKYSIDYSSSKIELAEEGHGQCSILEGFKLSMTSQIDMVDGGLSGHRIRLYVGYLSPFSPNGFIDFTFAGRK